MVHEIIADSFQLSMYAYCYSSCHAITHEHLRAHTGNTNYNYMTNQMSLESHLVNSFKATRSERRLQQIPF